MRLLLASFRDAPHIPEISRISFRLGKINRATASRMLTRGVIYNIFATFVSVSLNLKYSLNMTPFELRLSAEWAGETFRFHRPTQLIPELLDQ